MHRRNLSGFHLQSFGYGSGASRHKDLFQRVFSFADFRQQVISSSRIAKQAIK